MVLCVFGTRPELVKLAPVIHKLQQYPREFRTVTVSSGQHHDLLIPLFKLFQIRPNFDLKIMRRGQTLNDVCARVLQSLGALIANETPDLILVQGDTTTAFAAALVGFHQRIPVAHVEAGLRSGDPLNPFPEEMNRCLISKLATYHLAPTARNRETLLREGVPEENILVTGNPVVDSLLYVLQNHTPSTRVKRLMEQVSGRKLVVLTTHRRESFGCAMRQNLRDIRKFVEAHDDVVLICSVHPNPNAAASVRRELKGHARILLIAPPDYADFIHLLRHAWLLLSDSGGIQEEAPTLGKPLFVLRNNTERPEAIESGVAVLVGNSKGLLPEMLRRAHDGSWLEPGKNVCNPFGDGQAAKRIVEFIRHKLCAPRGEDGIATR